MITSCSRRCHCASSSRELALIWNVLWPVSISSTLSSLSAASLSECARRAWISPEKSGGVSFSNSMLRLESSRKAKGSQSPVGIFISSFDSSTVVTGRRQMESVSDLEPLITICVTSSMVPHTTPSTARMMSPWMSVPSRSAGPSVVIAPTVTSPSHRSTAMPSVPPGWSRTMVTSKNSSLITLEEAAFIIDGDAMSPSASSCASVGSEYRPSAALAASMASDTRPSACAAELRRWRCSAMFSSPALVW
mmetsp:Transcript_42233/g.116786  ORF Transcript_42233/g.116786 Transcript_42233/m.116786 type:complete len:249 (+) Transcript_42233:1809-2555(+)